ncbi:MAG: hypothetical protein C0459_11590 [Chitinophaga sp.]|nr:hypothetical protein [Chitinophaga sp.]
MEDKYKYEIQINQLPSSAIEGVTYSYKNIVFYGKASFKGIYTKGTDNVLVKELKMLELKISNGSEPCLMTCYLDYKKEGKLETLTGTYTSLNDKKKTDCGDGTIYLEKVAESDFTKEDFLLKKKEPLIKKDSAIKKIVPKPNTTVIKPNNSGSSSVTVTAKPKTTPQKFTVKPGAEEFVVKKGSVISHPKNDKPKDTVESIAPVAQPKILPQPLPPVLLERNNKLIETIEVNVKDVEISFYDNGKIDNDTITVYLNNEKVINYQKLDYKPIVLHLHLDENHPFDELITVADNLGDEPPNTALMVITAGNKRYEVTIASDEKNNAKVIIEYKPNGVKLQH